MRTPTPHDTWFHFTHQHPRHAAAWLRSCLPAALVAAIDWGTLRPCSERLHGLGLRIGVGDLVYEARLRGTRVRALPPLDPGTTELLERLQPPTGLHPRQPQRLQRGAVLARDLTALGKLNQMSLRFLRHCDPAHTLAALDRWGPILRAVDNDRGPIGSEAIATFGWYLLHVNETPAKDVHMALEKILYREEHTFMSTAEKLRREGLQQGLEQGLAQGRIETLLRLLNRRFGPLPATAEARLRSATSSDLDRWTDRILDAATLEAILADE